MPGWFVFLILFAIVGGILGYKNSDDDSRKRGAVSGALLGGALGALFYFFLGAIEY